MNWEAIGAIGETLGALAVFITLVYLAVQVRHARSEARRALSQGRGSALRDVLTLQIDERVNRLMLQADAPLGVTTNAFAEALKQRTGMTDEEAMVVTWNLIAWWNYYLEIIPKVAELSEIERAQFEVPIHRYGRSGVEGLFYESYIKRLGHPDAVRYIESVIAKPFPAFFGEKKDTGPGAAPGARHD
ncbi:MAG TPA: hypothetical protein VIS76_16660 [Pseudomonadales bacterium]